ncbi:MAG: hypothetical protein K2L52_00415, partial [Clostridia bacterium]|nr:hypothetical protein [Clostridia bacterium]
MNSKTIRAKYLKFAILIISVCFIIGAISACLPFNMSVPTLEDNTINDTAVTITTNASDGLGEFDDGYTYVYTDKSKIDDFRAGLIDYDITLHSVAKTSTNRGSQDNPYVLSSVADWETFVKLMETDSTHGSGKYYVLASCLDFTGETFHPVRFFSGTFYGMGNTISNIDCSTWQYYDGGTTLKDIASTTLSFGLFCRLTNATITDLVVEDFIYSQIPATSTYPNSTDRMSATGGIAGMSSGNDAVLNCHTSGEITSTITYTKMLPTGGIIGGKFTFGTANTTITFYRCSSNMEITIIGGGSANYTGPMYGGIFGENYNNNISSITYMYDCVANAIANNNASNQTYSGAMGYKYHSLYMENIVCAIDINHGYIGGAIFGLNSAGLSGTTYVKNVYSEGKVGVSTTTSKPSMRAIVSNSASVRLATSPNIANLNVVKNGTYATPYFSNGDALDNNTEPTEYPNSSAMVANAKTFFSATPYSNIWDVDKIGGEYTPDESPVRNYLMAFINFRNVINGGQDIENDVEKVGLEDGVGYVVGDKLPDETSDVTAFTTYLNNKKNANHVFKGWTDDPTGKSKPFTELPAGFFGDVTLYAVWGLPDSYVTSN